MTDQRFEDWWVRSPARVALSPAAKEVARGVWQAARDDLVAEASCSRYSIVELASVQLAPRMAGQTTRPVCGATVGDDKVAIVGRYFEKWARLEGLTQPRNVSNSFQEDTTCELCGKVCRVGFTDWSLGVNGRRRHVDGHPYCSMWAERNAGEVRQAAQEDLVAVPQEPAEHNCQGCGCRAGELHEDGCDVERCPDCGGQMISCDCDRHRTYPRLPWTGTWPGEAECREFGWWSRFVPGEGWVRCAPTDEGAGPDLNRLPVDAEWSAEKGRFVKRSPC